MVLSDNIQTPSRRQPDSAPEPPQADSSTLVKWLLAGNLLVLAILSTLAVHILNEDKAVNRQRVEMATRNLAQMLDRNIAALLDQTDVALQTIGHEYARQSGRGKLDEKAIDELLEHQHSLLPQLGSLRIVDAAGRVRYSADSLIAAPFGVASQSFFIQARQNPKAGLIIDGPHKPRHDDNWEVLVARRLEHADGSFLGVVYASIATEHFHRLFVGVDLGSDPAIVLRTADLRLVARYPATAQAHAAIGNDEISPELMESLRSNGQAGTLIGHSPIDRIERIMHYSRIGHYPLYIIVGQSTENYLADWREEVYLVAALATLAALAMLASSWMVYRLWQRQRRVTASLRDSEERFRLMVEGVRDYAVFMVDPSGRVATWNEGGQRLTDYRAEEIIGQHLSCLYPAADAARGLPGEALRLADRERSFESEGWRLRKDGSNFMADMAITAVNDAAGRRRGYTVILRDITIQRLAEQAAKRANALLREAVDSIAIGFSIYDPDDRLVICNEAYRDLFRTSRDLIVPGAKFEDIVRRGAELGQYPEADGAVEAWVRKRVRLHQAADGSPLEQELDDGRHLLVVEYRTPSGHIVGNRMDITELNRYRHHLERLIEIRTAEVRASMAQFRILIEQAPTAMAMLDREFNYLAVSRRWLGQYGRGHADLVGRNHYDIHPDLPERWQAIHRAALAGSALHDDEDLWLQADGSRHWLSWAAYPWTDEKGRIGGIIISSEDVTDRKQAEEQLRESEIRFRTAFEQAAVGLAHLDVDWAWLRVNRKLCDIVGYGREELLQVDFRDLAEAADGADDAGRAAEMLAGRIPSYSAEKRFRRRDGSLVWVNVTLSLVRTPTGQSDYFTAVVEDIQRRKEAEFALAEEREIFHNLSLITSDYFWELDEQFRFTKISRPVALRSSLDYGDFVGKARWDLPYLGMSATDWTRHRAQLEARQPFRHLELGLVDGEGQELWYSISGDPVFAKTGEFKGYRGVSQDITERKASQAMLESYQKRLEQQVSERTADLMAANKELQGFTYAASHDLKSPLGRINSFSSLLANQYRDRLDGNGLMFLDIIRRNATRMTILIDDLLSHAQIEQQILNLQPVDLRAAVHAALTDKAEDIRQGGAEVRIDLPAATVKANPLGISQVLRNLLENSLKYCPPARPPVIEIGAAIDGGCCRLWIKDNGIGFDMVYHDRIFEIFRRLCTYEEYPGSGVGLALVKKAMERMGGRVWAESAPNQGATFFLEFAI